MRHAFIVSINTFAAQQVLPMRPFTSRTRPHHVTYGTQIHYLTQSVHTFSPSHRSLSLQYPTQYTKCNGNPPVLSHRHRTHEPVLDAYKKNHLPFLNYTQRKNRMITSLIVNVPR